MGVLRSCTALFSLSACTSSIIVFLMCPSIGLFIVLLFSLCDHNIQFNIVDIVK
jgi:hypothetical protein